jgi:hypothetical protein
MKFDSDLRELEAFGQGYKDRAKKDVDQADHGKRGICHDRAYFALPLKETSNGGITRLARFTIPF